MMKETNKGILIVLFAVLITALYLLSCATPATVSVPADPRIFQDNSSVITVFSSFAAPGPIPSKAYYLASGNQNVPDTDLEFQTYARYIENALSQKGYVRTYDVKNADILVSLAYGIGDPTTSTSTMVTSNGYGYYTGYFWYYTPPTTTTETSTTYKRNLIVEAYDLKDPKNKSQLWKTTATSVGTSSDLRSVLAYMVTAAGPYFGTSTVTQQTVAIYGTNPGLLDILK